MRIHLGNTKSLKASRTAFRHTSASFGSDKTDVLPPSETANVAVKAGLDSKNISHELCVATSRASQLKSIRVTIMLVFVVIRSMGIRSPPPQALVAPGDAALLPPNPNMRGSSPRSDILNALSAYVIGTLNSRTVRPDLPHRYSLDDTAPMVGSIVPPLWLVRMAGDAGGRVCEEEIADENALPPRSDLLCAGVVPSWKVPQTRLISCNRGVVEHRNLQRALDSTRWRSLSKWCAIVAFQHAGSPPPRPSTVHATNCRTTPSHLTLSGAPRVADDSLSFPLVGEELEAELDDRLRKVGLSFVGLVAVKKKKRRTKKTPTPRDTRTSNMVAALKKKVQKMGRDVTTRLQYGRRSIKSQARPSSSYLCAFGDLHRLARYARSSS